MCQGVKKDKEVSGGFAKTIVGLALLSEYKEIDGNNGRNLC